MKISLLWLCLAFIGISNTYAQGIFKGNDAKLVTGIESGLPLSGNTVTDNFVFGVNVEKPLGQFSLGTKIQYSKTNANSFYSESKYLMVGGELKYRAPCNCIFGFAGLKVANPIEEAEKNPRYSYRDDWDTSNEKPRLIKELGLGANFPLTQALRIVFKAGYEFSDFAQAHRWRSSFSTKALVSSIGIQYGIQ